MKKLLVDIHSHILHGVDDGAQTLEDSINLAKLAVSEGIEKIVATPHHRNGYYINHSNKIIDKVTELQEVLDQNDIPLTLYAGQEIRLSQKFMDDLYDDNLLSIDNFGKYYLIEFPSMCIPDYTGEYFDTLIEQGITPIIAHPERNKQLGEDVALLANLIERGALAQLTTMSYLGKIGPRYQRISRNFIDNNLVQLFSSDSHHSEWRPFDLKEAYAKLENEFGIDKVNQFQANANDILNGIPIEAPKIKLLKSSKIGFIKKFFQLK